MKYSWTIVLVLACSQLKAQPGATSKTAEQWAIRFNPLGLIDGLDGNLSGGVERFLNNRWSVTTDISFVFYSSYIAENSRTLGYIVKPAVRYYTSGQRKFYLEAAAFFKLVGYKKTDWLGKDCVNDVSAFEEFETFIYRKRVAGINVQGGWKKELTRNKLLHMEIFIGIGMRMKWLDIKNDPRACYETNNFFDLHNNRTDNIGGSLPHGLRLVYSIR